MTTGFVLISTVPARVYEVHHQLQKIEEVSGIRMIFGQYGIIVKIEAGDLNHLGRIIEDRIRTLQGVTEVKTLSSNRA